MQARDVMSYDVATATPDMDVSSAARTMIERGVSGLPVVDPEGKVIGIISEGDLLHRAETGTERKSSWWLELVATPEERARQFVKSHARKVADLMTRRVLTAEADTPLADIATMMEEQHIKRVPIVDGGRLLGIVSRADLIRALAVRKLAASSSPPSDAELRNAVQDVLTERQLGGPMINVVVDGGVVHVWGLIRSEDEKRAVAVAAETVPGVARVENHVSVGPWLGYAE
jgi:CBS domain-containing protein